MELKGKITKVLESKTGISKAGKEWKKQEFVITTIEEHPKEVCLQTFKDYDIEIGNTIVCQIDISSREYNNKYYTDVTAWKIENDRSAEELKKANAPF